MGLLSGIKSLLNPVDGILTGVKEIVGLVTGNLPPADAAKVQVKMALLEAQAEKEKRSYDLKIEELYLKDAANLRSQIKTELQSEDAFVRRARPAWLWGLLGMYLINYPTTAIVSWFVEGVGPVDIPYQVHLLTGALVGGYQYLRTLEKTGSTPPFSK